MFRFHTTLQSVCDILYSTKKIIYDISEFPPCNVRNAAHHFSTLIKSHLPNPSSETLQSENVIMPKAKRIKVNWNKLFKKINSERKKQRPENSTDCFQREASCSVPESAESKDSGICIVFDSKAEKMNEPVLITVDSDENEDTVNNMGNSNSLVCDSAVQHNPGSWYCSVANWAGGSTCYADVQGSYSSKLVSQNEPEVLKSVESGDGALESATGSSRQAGRCLSKCIRYPPEA
jgi:hypothetical protein